MPTLEESWQPLAERLLFSSEAEMLKHLYLQDMMSIAQLSHLLGFAPFTIRRRLIIHGIALRGRGGRNRQGRALAFLDDHTLFHTSVPDLQKMLLTEHDKLVHPSTIHQERRTRKDAASSNSPTGSDATPEGETSAHVPGPGSLEIEEVFELLQREIDGGQDSDSG